MTVDFKWKLKTGAVIHVEADGPEWAYDLSFTIPHTATFRATAQAIEEEWEDIEQHASTLLVEAWLDSKREQGCCA